MKKTLLALTIAGALTISLAACGDNDGSSDAAIDSVSTTDGTTGGATTTGAPDAPMADTSASTADAAAVQEYTFHGTVKKVDTERQMITIDHEKIGDYMDAMTMPFKVADPALLEQVKVGQASHFTLRVAGDQALLTKVQDEHAPGEGH